MRSSRTYPSKSFSRFSDSFEPLFDSFAGGYINLRILPPAKESKSSQNNPENSTKHFILGWVLSLLFSFSLFSWEITDVEAERIGHQIFLNECGGKPEKLVWWNERENFASLGIGHFIWYPKGVKGPFEEVFPSLLAFFNARGIKLPQWLKEGQGCPWNSHQEFLATALETKKKELQGLLSDTIPLQAAFIVKRFEQTLHKVLSDLSEREKQDLLNKIESISQTSRGKYALIDYLHFKGAGTSQTERYCGQGWGLRQVLQEMPPNAKDPLPAFANTAKRILERRVRNAPPERHEERWLPGWLKRIDSYISFEI